MTNMNMNSLYGCFTMVCQDRDGRTRLLPFFRTVSEQISITNNVAKHPLDSGLYVNDHVTYEPETFDVSFIVNAHQIVETATIEEFKRNAAFFTEGYSSAITDGRGLDRIEAYRNELMTYRNVKWELNTTRHGVLDDYMIVSVSISAPDSGQSVDVKINFQKVRFGTATSVLLPTTPQAVKAAAMASGKGPGGMNISKTFGGMDMDWGLDSILDQVGAKSLLLSLTGSASGEPALDEPAAEYGDISEFGQSTPDSADPFEPSLPFTP
jgi:hypothetical protein